MQYKHHDDYIEIPEDLEMKALKALQTKASRIFNVCEDLKSFRRKDQKELPDDVDVKKTDDVVNVAAKNEWKCHECNQTFENREICRQHFHQKHLSVKCSTKS